MESTRGVLRIAVEDLISSQITTRAIPSLASRENSYEYLRKYSTCM